MSNKPKYWNKAKRILSKRDKIMRKLIHNYKDRSLVTRNDVFFSLCKSIIGQQISVAAANSVFLKFKKKCKNKITAKVVNKLSSNSLKSCGLSRQKVKGIKDLSTIFSAKLFIPIAFILLSPHLLMSDIFNFNTFLGLIFPLQFFSNLEKIDEEAAVDTC